MSGSFIPALERKPWERHVQTNAKSTFLAQNALPSPTLAPAVPMTTVRFANGSVWRQYQPQRGQSPGGYRLRPHYLAALTRIMSLFSFLDRSHTIAGPGFSRWMVPPAALCVHLCIGQAYAFSVFNLPMTKQLWIIYLGYGVLGGIGLGIGYISPVSTLIKWFPDRPGMATGMAIMGFGGG